MAELKTKATKESALKFLQSIKPDEKMQDSLVLLKMFKEITGEKAVMWGTSMVGFGKYHYKSDRSKQEGDWFLTGFSPRKQNLTLYVLNGNENIEDELFSKLGKYKASVGCLYINRLADVDQKILAKLIKKSFLFKKKTYKVINYKGN